MIILSGIQPKGTVVYQQEGLSYTETVLASNLRKGKQVVNCSGLVVPGYLYRVEYYWNSYPRHKAFYTRAEAMAFYRELK